MNDNEEAPSTPDLSYWGQHRIVLLVGISVTIALVLVSIAMALYASSGAAQLDLSRPGYHAISNQAVSTDTSFENYPAFGNLDEKAISDFKKLYDTQAARAKAVDAFGGDPLSPDALEISAP
jgi:hypothetical protein